MGIFEILRIIKKYYSPEHILQTFCFSSFEIDKRTL